MTRDAFGNVIGRLRGSQRELPEVWAGSHLDSVPDGGKYDGALGVVAAIEAVAAVGASARTLGVVAFRDEERGCYGSLALAQTGPLPGRYVELHVEQGPVLERAGAALGVVTGIVGSTRREVVFEGTAGHAGHVADGRALRRAGAGLGVRAPSARRGQGDRRRGRDGRRARGRAGRSERDPGPRPADGRRARARRGAALAPSGRARPRPRRRPRAGRARRVDPLRSARGDRAGRARRRSNCPRVRGTTRACSPQRASRRGCCSSAASTAA